MANKSRSKSRQSEAKTSGVVEEPKTTTRRPAAAVVAASEPERSSERTSKAVSLSAEDFDENPAVVNMASVEGVEGPSAADPAGNVVMPANEANEANARRIIDADRAKPPTSPFSNADLAAPSEDDEDDEDDPLAGAPSNVPGPAIEQVPAPEPKASASERKSGGAKLVTLGSRTKQGGRAPVAATVIIPRSGDDTKADTDGIITDGITVQLSRGRATRVSGRAAEWLASHPVYRIEPVEVRTADE